MARVPTPLGGLALGISSLGAVWSLIVPDYAAVPKLAGGLIAAILVLVLIIKFLLNPTMVKQDLSHPVVSSVMPTCAMATMVIAQALLPLSEPFARSLWLIAVALHLGLLAGFIWHRVKDFQLELMVPSWFVPPVGIIVASVTSVGMGHDELAYGLFLFGLTCYAVKLPVMLYRLLFRDRLSKDVLPTFAIMAAPASLSLAGYLTITGQPSLILIAVLAPLALIMTFSVYIAFVRLLRLPFSPGYAAFTFPMVIGATALLKLEVVLAGNWALLAGYLGRLELMVATTMVCYVAYRYIHYYFVAETQS
ncbi:TDT family transporter [Endozoicomonas sp. OPT23]|uniref:TDT family transporter n=1 Tax=Endozoicomonas sp. OPT23 TaxID=2072845 RepID=UPI001E3AF395|nr:TDT family transporter [Endozoicomonas sp. OPT23]